MILKTDDVYPFYKVDGNCIFGKNGDISFAFALSLPEIYSLSESDYDNINSEFFRFFKMLSNCVVHKQDFYLKRSYNGDNLEKSTFLQKATYQCFSGRTYFQHLSFIYITYTNLPSLKRTYLNSSILKTGHIFRADREKLAIFVKEVERAIPVFNSSNYFKLIPLSEFDIKELVFKYLNGFSDGKLTDIVFKPEFKIGDNFCNIYAVNSSSNLPENLPTCLKDDKMSSDDFVFYKGFLQPLGLELECNHVVNQVIYIDDHKEIKKQIQKSELDFRKFSKFSPENKVDSDKIKKYLDYINNDENIRLCRAHINVIVWDKDKSSLGVIDNTVVSKFKECDITPYHSTYIDHIYYFLCTLPGSAGLLPRQETFDTDLLAAATFFIPVTNYSSDERGLVFNDRRYNVPVLKDDFYKPYETKQIGARNAFIVASTGIGKSVLLNHILRQSVEQDFIVTLVEMGKSFEILSYLYPESSTYIQYREGEPLGLNPFLIRDTSELTADKVRSLANFIFILWKKDRKEEDFERVSLYKIIQEYYKRAGRLSFPDFFLFVKETPDLLSGLQIDPKFFDRDEFIHVTSEYAQGMFKFLLEDTKQNFYLNDKRFVGFELENIKDNLDILPIMFMSILDVTENVIWKNRTTDKRIWFDEAAKIIKYPIMLKTLDYYFQTIRKHNGSIGIVLQNINQVPDNEIGNAIIGNTHTFYILKQDKSIEPLRDRLNLSSHDCNQIQSISNNLSSSPMYTEFLMKMGDKSNVYRLELPKEALLAYRSEAKEKEPVLNEFSRIGSMEQAITNLLKNNL
jgi:conjugal transfer ATP-binding protein TraC